MTFAKPGDGMQDFTNGHADGWGTWRSHLHLGLGGDGGLDPKNRYLHDVPSNDLSQSDPATHGCIGVGAELPGGFDYNRMEGNSMFKELLNYRDEGNSSMDIRVGGPMPSGGGK
jgi:hypothetical protein